MLTSDMIKLVKGTNQKIFKEETNLKVQEETLLKITFQSKVVNKVDSGRFGKKQNQKQILRAAWESSVLMSQMLLESTVCKINHAMSNMLCGEHKWSMGRTRYLSPCPVNDLL